MTADPQAPKQSFRERLEAARAEVEPVDPSRAIPIEALKADIMAGWLPQGAFVFAEKDHNEPAGALRGPVATFVVQEFRVAHGDLGSLLTEVQQVISRAKWEQTDLGHHDHGWDLFAEKMIAGHPAELGVYATQNHPLLMGEVTVYKVLRPKLRLGGFLGL